MSPISATSEIHVNERINYLRYLSDDLTHDHFIVSPEYG